MKNKCNGLKFKDKVWNIIKQDIEIIFYYIFLIKSIYWVGIYELKIFHKNLG